MSFRLATRTDAAPRLDDFLRPAPEVLKLFNNMVNMYGNRAHQIHSKCIHLCSLPKRGYADMHVVAVKSKWPLVNKKWAWP